MLMLVLETNNLSVFPCSCRLGRVVGGLESSAGIITTMVDGCLE